jgi:hypothetical protein
MARPQVADVRDGKQIWKVAENILKKQPWTMTRGVSPAWGLNITAQRKK